MAGRAMNNPSTALPPFWMMKLTEDWGEPENDSKEEDDGNCFQNGGLTRCLTSVRRKKRLLFKLGFSSLNRFCINLFDARDSKWRTVYFE